MEYPEVAARFYDVIYDRMRTGVDSGYYLRRIREATGPVLEIGTGTGRFFKEALAGGADIYGIDPSPYMLRELKRKIGRQDYRRVTRMGMSDFRLDKKFGLILAPFRVFSHLMDAEEQLQALNNTARHLSERGRFLFDVFVPDPGMIAEGISDVVDFEGEYTPGYKLRRKVSMTSDIVNQVSDITMNYEWEEDGRSRNGVWHFRFRYFFRYELEHLVCRSNLRLLHMYGDFSENPLRKGSKEFIIECGR